MTTDLTVRSQLKRLGLSFLLFGRREIKELSNILNDQETIHHCIYGFYQGGSSLLVATDQRMLLIDKRTFFLNLEDIRYETINEIDFSRRLLDAVLELHARNQKLVFKSTSDARLRKLYLYAQNRITHARQLEHMIEYLVPVVSTWKPYTLLRNFR